jgi:predicted nucleotidyltransferase
MPAVPTIGTFIIAELPNGVRRINLATLNLDNMDTRKIAEEGLLFYTLSGSHAYGTNTPHSDEDWRGIFAVPRKIYMSAFHNVEIIEQFRGEKDAVVHELRKFMKLLVDQNPNIMELLWAPDDCIKVLDTDFKALKDARDLFVSKKAKFTFAGYAHAQLQRIKGHNKWINNPQPKRRPKEIDFVSVVWNQSISKEHNKTVPFFGYKAFELGGDIYGLVPAVFEGEEQGYSWHDAHEALITHPLSERKSHYNPDILVKFNSQLYKEHVENWKNYWDWVKNRNVARSELEVKYGYDTKHAAHLIRLLRMGHEILKTGIVQVRRPDATELLDIRNGKFTYEQVVAEAEGLESQLDELYKTSKLRHTVSMQDADDVKDMIYDRFWNRPKLV